MTCKRDGCGHSKKTHAEQGCRLTGCTCEAFVGDDPTVGARRICIDVPDGYMVSVSLVPYTAQEEASEQPSPT